MKNIYKPMSKMNWIKKIFGFKTQEVSVPILPLPETVLTPDQIKHALKWYDQHRNHVNKLVNVELKYPPTLNEDKRDCRLWKGQHWKWFLDYYH
jgi:hypothetical protein